MHGLVGWAKAPARNFPMAKTLVRRAHAVIIRNCARTRGHGARGTSRCGTAVPPPLPTLRFRHVDDLGKSKPIPPPPTPLPCPPVETYSCTKRSETGRDVT